MNLNPIKRVGSWVRPTLGNRGFAPRIPRVTRVSRHPRYLHPSVCFYSQSIFRKHCFPVVSGLTKWMFPLETAPLREPRWWEWGTESASKPGVTLHFSRSRYELIIDRFII